MLYTVFVNSGDGKWTYLTNRENVPTPVEAVERATKRFGHHGECAIAFPTEAGYKVDFEPISEPQHHYVARPL